MVRNFVNRGRGRANPNRSARFQIRQLRRELNGYAPKNGAHDPPVVNLRPFYPLVITLDGAGAGVESLFSVSTLVKRVTSQLGLTSQAAANMVLKIKSVRGWAYQYGPDSDRVSLNGEVTSLVPNISDLTSQTTVNPTISYPVIYRFSDFGSLNKPAHFGYVYPKAQQEVILSPDCDFNVLTVASNTVSSTIHFHLEWSTAEIQPPVDG